MANGNPLMNLFQPVAPGLSPAINPLVFIGSGMAQGNVAGSLAQMASIQQNAQQMAMMQERHQAQIAAQQAQEVERQRMREQEAANRVLVENYFRAKGQYGPREQLIAQTVAPDAFAKSLMTQADPTKELQLYQEMGGEAGTGMPFNEWYQEQFKAPGGVTVQLGEKLPANFRWRDPAKPELGVEPIPGGPAERPTERQQDIAAYTQNAEVAERALGEVGEYSPAGVAAADNPVTRLFASESDKRAHDLQHSWVMSILRPESGGVIGDEEIASAKQTYFPQPGDTDVQVAEKKRLRDAKIKSLKDRAGKAYTPMSAPAAPAGVPPILPPQPAQGAPNPEAEIPMTPELEAFMQKYGS